MRRRPFSTLNRFILTAVLTIGVAQVLRWFWPGDIFYNPGLAFSWQLPSLAVLIVSGGFLALVGWWFYTYRWLGPIWAVAGGMIFGGGASNLLERFMFDGKVADYINFFNLTTTNLADLVIVVGIGLALKRIWNHQ
ncbi:hypothetical protein A3K24_01310 [candidate division Kazan bacterium RIFCSPHIGHO2_01_FULL_44_14]|uniref:Uncharacterized protein n=1 Tax=candidate division Kazan bacterium RIFCSPLOWO2_01_FULL_45_19 TaxID=1798538 RepID=A0A1F4NPV0_UNCK3|nr:hypothetical protein [uncultured bacterium]OGB73481.1 MAG: hypothetical protein A3K51_01310 [candidate division Kazan bacterium RIFCSPLOWO2_01_FULL_45_19]OGB77726.1 MAG: hypothetical protein A3K24_01310 [candidate division Kazan bacterium RIFCSPHIGHO2_01_FULL_44_14]